MSQIIPQKQTLRLFFQKDHIVHELESHRRWVERFMFILGLVSAAMAIPQIISIYKAQDSSQVSLSAWAFYAFAALLWIVYAVVFKMNVTKRVNIVYFVVNVLVVGVILWYR